VASQTFTATLVASNNNGCRDSVSAPILVNHQPDAQFSYTGQQCLGTLVNFINGSIGASGYNWNFGDNSPVSVLQHPPHTYTNTGINNITFTVLLTVTTASNCSDTAYGYPVIYARPVSDFTFSAAAGCAPLNTQLSFTGANAHKFTWHFGDGSSVTGSNVAHTFTNSSNATDQSYQVSLVALNNNGCRDSTSKPVTVYYKPFADFTLDTPACSPKKLVFTNKSSGAVSYKWEFGGGLISTAIGTVSQVFTNTSLSPVLKSVMLISTSNKGCSDSSTVSFFVYPKPEFYIEAKPDSGCSPLRVFFPKLGAAVKYQWTFEPGSYSESGDVENIFVNKGNEPKTFPVQLIAQDAHGCADTSTRLIRVFPAPSAKFTASPLQVYVPNDETKCFNLSSGATSYQWFFGDGETSSDKDPVHAYARPGEFKIVLVAENAFHCRDTATLPEKVVALGETEVQVPNAFSPNLAGSPGGFYDPEDRSNDVFHPNVKGADQYQLSIYSRWGELLFDTKNPREGWDGYYKGKLCTQDVYVYKIVATFLDGRKVVKTGDILLLR
jgi:gliding motility-associated-like protein